ncbi:MAG: ABC transporter permease [Lewinella sp.]|uniref:ABC transporter permease n=1 Tax=Lewinella sp. TaxID=2004506 RepID=UPI003D6C1511
MIKNYLKIALRNLRRSKVMSFINISGLAIGIATCLLILLFVQYEWSFDRYHEKADRIVRVIFKGMVQGEKLNEANVMPPVAEALKDEFPEVEAATRLRVAGRPTIIHGEETYKTHEAALVDADFFSVFTLPLISGDAATALVEPNSIVISEAVAEKFFGGENPLGKTLDFKNGGEPHKVTGVMKEIPENSHFQFDIFIAMSGLEEARKPSWMTSEFYTYLVLPEGYDYKELEAKLPTVFDKYAGPQMKQAMGMGIEEFRAAGNDLGLFLQPLTDIHLYSDFAFDLSPHGDIRYLYIFGAIALFMLFIACINFMNISTAGASKRAKEVGVRKVMGSRKRDLIWQFLLESILLAMLSLAMAIVLVSLALPLFNEVADKHLSLNSLPIQWLVPGLLLFGLLVGTLAGSYPAFFLSSFRPSVILKGSLGIGNKSVSLRQGLVVFQFFLTIALMICTGVVFRQLQFIQDAKLGYDTSAVLVVPELWALGDSEEVFRQQLAQDPRVVSASYSGYLPAGPSYNNNFFLTQAHDNTQMVKTLRYDVDEHYLPTLNMKLVAGRNFSAEMATDASGIILNEASALAFGWKDEEALGQQVVYANNQGEKTSYQVLGVVEDFHFKSLHEQISPLVMVLGGNSGSAILKVQTDDVATLLADLKKNWTALTTELPFDALFLDERIYETYKAERRVGVLLAVFAGLTIFVACLGLFGLTVFATEQRTKEIGVRKVLGASVASLVQLLSKDFIKLVAVAYVLACPLAWWIMNQWLEDFAYRITLNGGVFALAGILALAIAFLTVGYQSIKAALAHPLKSLRSE